MTRESFKSNRFPIATDKLAVRSTAKPASVGQRKAFDHFGIEGFPREDVDSKRHFAFVDIDQREHAVTDADRVADGKLELVCLHALPPAVFQTSQ
jgi:hypothetical protein